MARILVVDDDSVIRELLTAVLEEESDHEVIVAGNGQEALERLAEDTVDAIVCDVNMPVMDGYELVRAVRAQDDLTDLPILMISAAVSADELDPELQVDLMLEKPFEINALLACVSYVLGRVRAGSRTVRVTRRRAAMSVNRMLRQSRDAPGNSRLGGSVVN
jgi:CheY-like chemotaxis protein